MLKHARNEGLGRWETRARVRDIAWRELEVGDGEEVLSPEGFDAIVSLGGPMSADDEAPALAAERALLARAVRDGVPVLGVCLGAQLLAHALGACVYTNPGGREVGLSRVSITPEGRADPLFAGLPDPLPVMQWHGDAFDLPTGATLLARSSSCENQAFRVGERAYGLLFHPEVGGPETRDWLSRQEYRDYAEGAGRDPDEVLAESRRLGAEGVRLFENWLGLLV